MGVSRDNAMRFHNDPGHYVAHYTRYETAVDCILKNRSLKLGPLIATNDPRETKTWQFSVGTSWSHEKSQSSDKSKALAKKNIELDRLLKQGCKILCVSQDSPNAFKQDISSRAYGKPRMWSQYAGNHKGVCMLFDKKELHKTLEREFKDNKLFFGLIDYQDFHNPEAPGWMEHMAAFHLSADEIAADGLDATLRRHRDKYNQVFFFRKNRDWEHESEYRWILRGKDDEPEFIPIESALRAILLGIDFPMERLDDIYSYCVSTNTSLSRIVWINGMPEVHWFEPSHLSTPKHKQALEMCGLKYCG